MTARTISAHSNGPGAGAGGQHAGGQPDGEDLKREIADGCGDGVDDGPPGQGPGRGIGEALRQHIGDAEDQDRAQRDGLRRLVLEAEAEARPTA